MQIPSWMRIQTCKLDHFLGQILAVRQKSPYVLANHFIVLRLWLHVIDTVYPKKYAHGFCFAVLCCGYTLTDFPISIRLTSLALWQSNDCPSASKATLMNMDKYFMWIHYQRLHNHNKAKHNKTECIFLGIYCTRIVAAGWYIVDYFWQSDPFWLLVSALSDLVCSSVAILLLQWFLS